MDMRNGDVRSKYAYDKIMIKPTQVKLDSQEASKLQAAYTIYGRLTERDNLRSQHVCEVAITAPIKDIIEGLRGEGFFHPIANRPQGNAKYRFLTDEEIIRYYAEVMRGILNFYRPADNLPRVKAIVENLRISCLYTLASKHKRSQK